MKTTKTTEHSNAGATQCEASFQLPDGTRRFCQRRRGHANRHLYNVARHPVLWSGTADERTPHCGYAMCTGKPAQPTPASPVEVADFHPDMNDATKEAPDA